MSDADASSRRGDGSEYAALLETLVRHAPLAIAFLDLDFRFTLVNDRFAAMNGRSHAEHIGRPFADVAPHLWLIVEPFCRRAAAAGQPAGDIEIASAVAPAPGEDRRWLASCYPVHDREARVRGVAVIATELTEQKRAEARHRAIVAAMPDFVFDLGSDGTHYSFHAPQEEQLYVRADRIIGRRVRDLMPADVADVYEGVIAETLRTARMQMFEYALDYPDGRQHFEGRMVRKSPETVLAVVRNITDRVQSERDRQRLEEQVLQSHRMEAVGQLAGGVAHDFNNLLTIINGYAEQALDELPADAPVRDAVAEVLKAGERAGTLTRQLLLFSRQQVLEPRVLDLNAVAGNMHKMLARVIGEDVTLTMDLEPALGAVRMDQGQIEQVLLNLAVNARDAMPTGGRLTIATANAALDESAAASRGVRGGRYVALAVSDTGIGIDEATKTRIFEPFFTTKVPGKGTGLGLAVTFGVVRQTGGFIDVTSAPGAGTTFTLHFPVVDEPIDQSAPVRAPDDMPLGDEVLLLVEDDAAVRRMTRRVLERCGYTILEAGDGQEAVTLVERYEGPLHLLLSDVVMPHVGGRELAEAVSRMRPGIKVMFLSGYTDDAVMRHGIQREELAFLQKPFTPGALANKVRAVLDQARQPH